jgi:hypothetical protein
VGAHHQDQLTSEVRVICRESRGDEAAEGYAHHGRRADLRSQDLGEVATWPVSSIRSFSMNSNMMRLSESLFRIK